MGSSEQECCWLGLSSTAKDCIRQRGSNQAGGGFGDGGAGRGGWRGREVGQCIRGWFKGRTSASTAERTIFGRVVDESYPSEIEFRCELCEHQQQSRGAEVRCLAWGRPRVKYWAKGVAWLLIFLFSCWSSKALENKQEKKKPKVTRLRPLRNQACESK